MVIRVGEHAIGDGHPTFIVAEMAAGHDGSVEKAARIIEAAAQGGANAVNFHLLSLEDYMVPSYASGPGRVSAGKEDRPLFEYVKSLTLGWSEWERLYAHARDLGLIVSLLCNDYPSVEFAAQLDPELYMIHPSALGEEAFVRAIARQHKPVVLYIGGCWLSEVERAVFWAKDEGNQQLILQHGFQSYPTAPGDMNLRFIQSLKQLFGFPVAFGDHTDGGSELALIVPLLAAALGANVVEKHLTYDRSARGEDFESALDPADFETFVHLMRHAEEAFGSSVWRPLSERELAYRQVVRKRAVASRRIAEGALIGPSDIAFKRSDEGIYPEELHFLLGRRAKRELAANAPLTWDVVE